MNIETVYNILKMLKSFLELLKDDMSLETLKTVREIKGSDVLENYEKMFEIDALGTKNNLRNYIINEINSLSTAFIEVSKYNSDEIKTFIPNLIVPEVDTKKLDFIVSKFDDPEAYNLISHKISLTDYAIKIGNDARYLSLLKTDDDIKINLKDIIKDYNIILDLIATTLNDKEIITFDVDGKRYGYGIDNSESIVIKDYMVTLKSNLKEIKNKLSSAVNNIKDGVNEIDYRPALGESLRQQIMNTVDEFCKDMISVDTYDYLYKKQINILEFYVRTNLAYILSIVSYIEHVSSNVEALKDVDNAVEISYSLFNKSE